ncbi:unnamed protein product, partial [Ixodes hexagonus]
WKYHTRFIDLPSASGLSEAFTLYCVILDGAKTRKKMQWYFLFLLKDEKGQEFAEQYLSRFTELASRVAGQIRLAANHIGQLAPEESFHYALVPALMSSFENLGPTLSWNNTTFETFRGDLRRSSEELAQLRDLYELPSEVAKREADCMARLIHDLLDRLPCSGTFMLDAVVNEALLDHLDITDNVQLYGALLRLWKWHHTPLWPLGDGAHFVSWRKQLGIGSTPGLSVWPPLWKGHAKVGNGTPFGNFEIECSVPPAELAALLGIRISHQDRHVAEDNLLWSSTIEVLDEFGLESLPAHLLCPMPLRLVTRSARESKDFRFLEHCTAKPERCAVVRLSYWDVCDLKTPPPQRTSRAWRAAVRTRQWLQDFPAQEPNGNLHFVLIPHGSSAMLLPLQKTPPALVSSLDLACSGHRASCEPTASDGHFGREALQGIPLVSSTSIFSSVQRVNTAFLAALRDFLGKFDDKGSSSADATGFASALSELSIGLADLVVDGAHVPVSMSESSSFSSFEGCQLSEMIGDPSDWPERRALLQSSASMAELSDNRTMTKNGSGLKTIAVSAKDILKFFDESGNARRPPTDTIYYERDVSPPSEDRERLRTAEWPRCLQSRYHDVYYNTHSESCENCGKSTGESAPVDETATTCDPNRTSSVLAIAEAAGAAPAPSSHVLSPVPRRSPRKTLTTTSLRDCTANTLRRSPRKKSASITSQQMSSPRLRKSPRKGGVEKRAAHRNPRTVTGRLVASLPRKSPQEAQVVPTKVPRRLEMEGARREGEVQASTAPVPNPGNLAANQKLRLKLRAAVAKALEQNGVAQSSPLFKSCGKELFAICWTFAKDLVGSGRTSQLLQTIADSHVKPVVEFVRLKAGCSKF